MTTIISCYYYAGGSSSETWGTWGDSWVVQVRVHLAGYCRTQVNHLVSLDWGDDGAPKVSSIPVIVNPAHQSHKLLPCYSQALANPETGPCTSGYQDETGRILRWALIISLRSDRTLVIACNN